MFKYLRQKAIKDKLVSLSTSTARISVGSLWSKTTVAKYGNLCVISGFRREVDEIWAILENYSAYSGNSLPQVSGQFNGPIFKDQDTEPWRWER